jgi:hypothetical protein
MTAYPSVRVLMDFRDAIRRGGATDALATAIFLALVSAP